MAEIYARAEARAYPGSKVQLVCLATEFGANGVGYGISVVAHQGLGLGFDHDAGEGLCAGVTNDNAT